MRLTTPAAIGAALALTLGFTPAADVPVPVFAENVELVGTVPDAGGISLAIDPARPFLYLSTARGIDVYDITDPTAPSLVGATVDVVFENEAMNAGSAHLREDGTTFVVTGADIAPNVSVSSPGTYATGAGIFVFDVTDPAAPYLRSSLVPSTGTHTISCVDEACEYAYTSGGGRFSILDLRDLDAPKEVGTVDTVWTAHDWDRDDAGVLWSTSWDGTAAWDVADPTDPVVLNATGLEAKRTDDVLDFVHHNMARPNATAFDPEATDAPYDLANGNVALITEEDYDDPSCATEGSLQTWGIPSLAPGDAEAGRVSGSMEVLDLWNTEIYSTGEKTRAGAFCSAHYFTVHEAGLVAQGWYQQGLRILDVSDPTDIQQVGYFLTQAQEVWHAYWVPERDEAGAVVRHDDGSIVHSDLIYALDTARGIDVLRFTALDTPAEERTPVEAPILPTWLGQVAVFAPRATEDFGYACLIPLP